MQKLNKGFLKDIYDKCLVHFLDGIDPQIHADAYVGEHAEKGFAESEFAGKYMDTCVCFYRYTGDERVLSYAKRVADSVLANQRADGYIGGNVAGEEWSGFSVWNQAFTAIGMISVWRVTDEARYLGAAEASVSYIATHFLETGADILDAPNAGSQHLAILISTVMLYEITQKEIYRNFADYILNSMKGSDNDFTDFRSILELRSKKAIENFCALIGMALYAEQTDDEKVLGSVRHYRDELAETQITVTGNGTVGELWYENGNTPRFLGIDERPNENCVAVGWAELNAVLFKRLKQATYLDEIEKTLFNHILGSLDRDCTDFAYYQPNYGKRITRTAEDVYKCCRYRGFSAVSNLPMHLFCEDGDAVIPMIYTNASFENQGMSIQEETGYPFDGQIKFTVKGSSALKLRIPAWCKTYSVMINGKSVSAPYQNGFIILTGEWNDDEVILDLHTDLQFKYADIEDINYCCITYGSIVCVLNCQAENEIFHTTMDLSEPMERVTDTDYNMEFTAVGYDENGNRKQIQIVDYASAAKQNETDEYTIWIKNK